MDIWIRSLSWALIYALGQGFVVYAALQLVLKLVPASSNTRYHLSLTSLALLFVWFIATLWQQLQAFSLTPEQPLIGHAANTVYLFPLYSHGDHNSYSLLRSSFEFIAPWLSAFYIIGLTLMLTRLSGGIWQLHTLKNSGLSKPATTFDELLASLKNRLNFNGPVQLFISAKAKVPMVIGFVKPAILVPAAALAQLTTEQLETILLHELAHIKRNDYLINILQTVVETVLFFNPFVWMISSTVRREREHCCDDMVLEHSYEPIEYATALAALASPGNLSAFTIAANGQKNYLFHRIKRIMEMKKNPFSYSRMAAAILIVAIITCSVAWLAPSFARPGKERPDKITTSRSAATDNIASAVNGDNEKKMMGTPGTMAIDDKKQAPGKTAKAVPVADESAAANIGDEQQLVQLLLNDKVVDEITGFVVEKKQDKLFIDGKQQSDELANKYLSSIKKQELRVQVFSLAERLKMHPDGGLIKNLMPVSFSSGCVDYQPKKPGC